jgi:dethiobiotin synthetase
VGKTWVAARLIETLVAAGCRLAARKPVQSFEPDDDPAGRDGAVLARASGEDPGRVCPRSLPRAMAPPLAARSLGLPPFTLDDLVAGLDWPHPPPEVGLVEGAGGLLSPLAEDGTGLDLLARLDPDVVVLVAGAALGAINAVRLSAAALAGAGLAPPVVALNRFDPGDEIAASNAEVLRADGLEVHGLPGALAALAARVRGRP